MKRFFAIFMLVLLTALAAPAQGLITIRRSATVPVTCDPSGLKAPALYWKTSTTSDSCGNSKGLCECTATNTWTYRSSAITAGTLTGGTVFPVFTGLTLTTPGTLNVGGQVLNSAGSAIAPSYSFSGDQNTGITSSSADVLGFVTGGAQRWTIDASGTLVPFTNNVYDIGTALFTPRDLYLSRNINLNGAVFSNLEILLSTTASVNMNTATPTVLYTCPTGKSCVVTRVVVRNASTSLTTASYSFGWVSAGFTDVIANATHTELTGNTLYTVLSAKAGSRRGVAAETFNVLMNTLQGGAATTTIDVFGYVF